MVNLIKQTISTYLGIHPDSEYMSGCSQYLLDSIEKAGMLPPTMIRSVYDVDGNNVTNQLANKFEEDLDQNDEDLNTFKTDTVTEWKEVKRTT